MKTKVTDARSISSATAVLQLVNRIFCRSTACLLTYIYSSSSSQKVYVLCHPVIGDRNENVVTHIVIMYAARRSATQGGWSKTVSELSRRGLPNDTRCCPRRCCGLCHRGHRDKAGKRHGRIASETRQKRKKRTRILKPRCHYVRKSLRWRLGQRRGRRPKIARRRRDFGLDVGRG